METRFTEIMKALGQQCPNYDGGTIPAQILIPEELVGTPGEAAAHIEVACKHLEAAGELAEVNLPITEMIVAAMGEGPQSLFGEVLRDQKNTARLRAVADAIRDAQQAGKLPSYIDPMINTTQCRIDIVSFDQNIEECESVILPALKTLFNITRPWRRETDSDVKLIEWTTVLSNGDSMRVAAYNGTGEACKWVQVDTKAAPVYELRCADAVPSE